MADGAEDLWVFFVFADASADGVAPAVSPPFGTADEAHEYQAEYGGTAWRFPVPLSAGEVVAPNA